MVVQEYSGTSAEWDAFVRAQAGWTHFHQYGWRRVMENALGHETLYLSATDETGSLTGVLPLVRVKSRLFGHFLVSMPFLNYGGPLGVDEVDEKARPADVHRRTCHRDDPLVLRLP